MKVGLYTVDLPASLGGGFVLRDDLVNAATNLGGRHQFESVIMPAYSPIHTRAKIGLNRIIGRSSYTKTSVAARLSRAVSDKKLDILWFNHFEPVHVGVPYVLGIFDLQHRLQPGFPEVSAGREWEHRELMWAEATRRAAMVTVGSQEAKEQLCHFYGVPLENVWVLPFPTPQKAIGMAQGTERVPEKQDVREKYRIKNDFVFYPAQFWPHKNHANLLLAIKLLNQRRDRKISLVLTGSDHGNREYVVRTSAELGVADLVHFCGFVPYEDILTFYREARGLCYVSFFGPENLPPLEAMALGCPVVLSNIPGVRALHGDGPILVNPRDPQSIADGIALLLDKPEQVQDRIAAGRRAAIQNDCAKYLESFQTMLDEYAPIRRCWP